MAAHALMQQKELTSFDGTRIVYQVGGRGERWLVVANGYGGSFWAWQDIFRELAPSYRLLLWDYRGFYRSGLPDDLNRLRVEDSCRDLDLLMEAEGVERMVLAGWSVGVQVALEHYRRRPETVDALVLINGAHGRVLHRSADGRLAALLLPVGIAALRRASPVVARTVLPALRVLARSPWALKLLSTARLVTGEPAAINEALNAVLTLDFGVYAWMGLLADQHDTEDLLPHVAVPTLVTAGDRDIITRPRVARHVSARIPGADYFEIPGGTHYAVMEFPRLLANRIHSFVRANLELPADAAQTAATGQEE